VTVCSAKIRASSGSWVIRRRLPEQKNPAAALLKIQQQGGGEPLSIQVISENVIAILDGEWAGRYYRLL
jgi:hypothetical protein